MNTASLTHMWWREVYFPASSVPEFRVACNLPLISTSFGLSQVSKRVQLRKKLFSGMFGLCWEEERWRRKGGKREVTWTELVHVNSMYQSARGFTLWPHLMVVTALWGALPFIEEALRLSRFSDSPKAIYTVSNRMEMQTQIQLAPKAFLCLFHYLLIHSISILCPDTGSH